MINISEIRKKVFARDMFTCRRCGNRKQSVLSMAHRIKSGKGSVNYIKKYMMNNFRFSITKQEVQTILYHADNLIVACRGNCNDSYNIFNQPVNRDRLMIAIFRKAVLAKYAEITC